MKKSRLTASAGLESEIRKKLPDYAPYTARNIAEALKIGCDSAPILSGDKRTKGRKQIFTGTVLEIEIMKNLGLIKCVDIYDEWSREGGKSYWMITRKGEGVYRRLEREDYFRNG